MTSLISLLYKGLSRIFSSTTLQKHQFFITQPSAAESGALSWFSGCTGPWEVVIIFITSTIVLSQVKQQEGTQPCPPTENWTEDLLSMAPPIRTRPSFPHNQSKIQFPPQSVSPSGNFQKPLIHQRADRRQS